MQINLKIEILKVLSLEFSLYSEKKKKEFKSEKEIPENFDTKEK